MSVSRRPNETFEAYKERRRQEEIADRIRLQGQLIAVKESGIDRTLYRELLAKSKKELEDAHKKGLSDGEIYDALMQGDESEQRYARFLRDFVMDN